MRDIHLGLVAQRLRDRVTLLAGGGIAAAEHVAKVIACGADGVSGTAWVDPTLTMTTPLGEARIPLLSIPGLADLVFGAEASIGLQAADGKDHLLSLAPTIESGGLGLASLDMNPELVASITGSGEAQALLGLGTAGVNINAELQQALVSHYDSTTGWSNSAPGSLRLAGSVYYDTLWGLGVADSIDLFEWEVTSFDFLSQSPTS